MSAALPPNGRPRQPWLLAALLASVAIGAVAWAAWVVQRTVTESAALRQSLASAWRAKAPAQPTVPPPAAVPTPAAPAQESVNTMALRKDVEAMSAELAALAARSAEREKELRRMLDFKQAELETANKSMEELRAKLEAIPTPPTVRKQGASLPKK